MSKTLFRKLTVIFSLSFPIIYFHLAAADASGATQIQNFIESIIKIIAGLAGLIATAFFVVGGLRYIASSGDPRHLDQAKKTIFYSAVGLSITIAAFVLCSLVTNLATNAFGS